MIKLQVICDKCGKVVELKPQDNGNHSYVYRALLNKDFYIQDIDIEKEVEGDLDEISDVDDLDVNAELKEIRIDCRNCGEFIVLTGFDS